MKFVFLAGLAFLFCAWTHGNPGTTPSNAYVAEDGTTNYVAEDGTTFYVQEI